MATNKSFFMGASYGIANYLEQELSTKRQRLRRGTHFTFPQCVPSHKVLTLWLAINPTFSKRIMGMTHELSQAAQLERGSFIRAEWGGEGIIELQIPKPQHLWTTPKVSRLPVQDGVKTAVGLDTRNHAAIADFSSPVTAHCLVAGLSGSGKTELQRLLAFQLAMQNSSDDVKFLLFDTADRGLAWDGFGDLPHLLHGIIDDVPTALGAMDWLTGEMVKRAETRRNTPRLFVFVDEIQELSHESRFVRPAETLARRGRKWGINLVLATQRPVKESMGSMNVKANLGLRLVGKVTSAQESLWATDLAQAEAQTLLGPGDVLMITPGVVQRIATPLLTTEDLDKLPHNGTAARLNLETVEEAAQEIKQGRRQDHLESHQVAVALTQRVGINRLSKLLRIGNTKAKRVLGFAKELQRDLALLGYAVSHNS